MINWSMKRHPDQKLATVRLSELPDVASLRVNIDEQRVAALGLNAADVNNTLSTAWGGRYVNDFIDRGRVKRVYVQGDAPYRASPADIDQWFVRNNQGQMVPFSSFAQTSWQTTPTSSSRFLGYPSFELSGQGAPGNSSGQAMTDRREPRKCNSWHRRGVGGSVLPGTTVVRSGADPL